MVLPRHSFLCRFSRSPATLSGAKSCALRQPGAGIDPQCRHAHAVRQVDDEDQVAAPFVVPGRHYKIACNHALAGLIGLVESIADDECRVWVDMLGKAHLIALNVEDLEEIANGD